MSPPLLLAVLAVLAPWSLALPARPVVSLGQGLVVGRRLLSAGSDGYSSRDYAAFYGVPFAKPPVGALRFKPPEPAPVLNTTLLADTPPPVCIQQRRAPDAISGSEDCLTLHIFTPNYDRPSLDVIVFIHGGGFMFGEGKRYGQEDLMDRNVVFVTIEYRLGILGFMSLEDSELPGNLGMLDQVMALQWIKDNISAFGGNSSSITVLGFSAGSASGFLHLMSPLSKGLFHKFLAVSGSPLNPWAQQHNARENALKVGQLLNCSTSSSRVMLDCLRGKEAADIVALQKLHFQGFKETPFSPFAPVVDGKTSQKPFLTSAPHLLLEKKQVHSVPVVMSMCKDEGIFTAAEFVLEPASMKQLGSEWASIAPGLLHFHASASNADKALVAKRIRDEYFANATTLNSTTIVKLSGDRNFGVGITDQARLHAAASSEPVYMYIFGYRGQYSLSVSLSQGNVTNLGVSHADDLLYPLNFKWAGPLTTAPDKLMRKMFIDMWVSFANTSVPVFGSATWNPVSRRTSDELQYLYVAAPSNTTMMHSKEMARASFWKSLPIMENGAAGTGSTPASTASTLSVTLATLVFLGLSHLHRL